VIEIYRTVGSIEGVISL